MFAEEVVRQAAELGASDIHLVKGLPVRVRIDGSLQDMGSRILSHEDCEKIAMELGGEKYDSIRSIGELDLGGTLAGRRVRINLFRQQASVSAAIRILNDHIPKLSSLGLSPVVNQFSTWNKGIILVTGETGSGKSTTMASVLDQINHNRHLHIITLEDPIEYVYTPDKCVINQREIGKDTESYENGMRAILREDPDIILIGEMRDLTTIETALTAAETGHLVFATLHTNNAADAVDRMTGIFPENRQPQIRLQLSMTLKAVLSQQLLVRKSGHGRVAACEAMVVTPAIRNLIREGKTPQIYSAILSSAGQGSITMENCLVNMVMDGIISQETALEAAGDKEFFRKRLGIR